MNDLVHVTASPGKAVRAATYAVVDVETTGIDPSSDRVVEVACVVLREDRIVDAFSTLIHPGRSVPATASAVHGITDAMLAGAPSLATVMPTLQALCADAVVVAHNAPFDLAFLPFLADRPVLCSMRLAQRTIPDAPNYKNQVLRYHLGVETPDFPGVVAHRALSDVHVTAAILRICLERYLANGCADDVAVLVDTVAAPLLFASLPFGRHRGTPLRDVPIDYLKWALGNASDISTDVAYSIKHELKRRSRSM